jgi:glycosyltransferase involved in cell wall biosynthesis
MRIGVAIPCFIKHINRCYELLDSINAQTRLPDEVVVSCSSSKPEDFVKREYKFPLTVITTEDKYNTAQNRNSAASKLTTDIISFIDADDIMHPQRLEAIEKAVEMNANIVFHSFFTEEECKQEFPNIIPCEIRINTIQQSRFTKCIEHKNLDISYKSGSRIHQAQISVLRILFERVKFREAPQYELCADAAFCYDVLALPNIITAYIPKPLSKYIPSGTCYPEKQ